jgi:hypothetical protein
MRTQSPVRQSVVVGRRTMATRRRTTGSSSKKPAARKPSSAVAARHLAELEQAVMTVAEKVRGDGLLRDGSIVLRSDKEAAGGLLVRAGRKGVELAPLAGGEEGAPPLLEVIGDPRRLAAIVRGEKDGRKQFLAGGIRVRGDMDYLSELGMQLGFLDKPIG